MQQIKAVAFYTKALVLFLTRIFKSFINGYPSVFTEWTQYMQKLVATKSDTKSKTVFS